MWQSGSLVVTKGFQLVAQVAELVDAQVSGTCDCKVVEVRVFSWAPDMIPSDFINRKY